MKHSTYKSNVLILALLMIMTAQNALAQNTRNLSLDEAIQLSLQSSKQLKLSKARVDEATSSLRQARENMLPDIKASGAYLRVSQPNIDLKAKLGSSSSSGSGSGETGSSAPSINVDQAAYGIVNASLPLFSGLRIQHGIESAKYLAKAAQLDADNDREAVIENTINAYNNLYKAKKAVDLVNEDLKQSKQRVNDFTNMEKNGLLARNDLLKVELQESNVELTLLDAQNNWEMANINMDLMLGLPENTELIPDSAALESEMDTKNISDWEAVALQNRKDLQAINFRQQAAIAGVKAAKGEYYPSIALTGGYIAADIPNFIIITNALTGGVGLQYNFGALYKTGAKVAQARARVQQMEASQELLSDQVRIQISQAYKNYVLSQKKIDVYTKSVEQANENYKITKNKYDNSLATTTDLLDADVAQLQAKLNYEYAKADAMVAYKRLLQTAGILTFNQTK